MADLNENNDNIEMKEEETVPSERIKKMKQKLERLVKKMKQPDEDELVDSFRIEDKKEEKKDNEEYEIKDIFADTDGNEPDIFDEAEEKEEKQVEFVEKEKAKEFFEKLPEYNIFDENADESEIHKNEEIEEIIKKADTEKSVSVEKKEKPNINPVVEKKEQPKITEIRSSPSEEEKNLSQGDSFHIVYHSEETEPFIVIAGKFGRTLRGEYEATREYRESRKAEEEKNSNIVQMPKKPPVQQKKTKIESKKPSNAAVIIKKIEPVEKEVKVEKEIQEVKKGKAERKADRFDFKKLAEMIYSEPVSGKQMSPEELDDYTAERDAEDVKTEIEKNLHTMIVRTSVLFIAAALSIVLAAIMQFTPLFSETMRTGWLIYGILSFALFTAAVAVARLPIMNGLLPLRKLKGNSDTAAAVTALAAGIQSVTALCTPYVFTNGTYHIYVPIAITALFFNSLGKLLIITRTLENFKFLSKSGSKYAGKIYTDTNNAEKMASEFPARSAIIGYMKRSKFMSNFLRLSYAPDPSEKMAAKVAPIVTVISLIMGLLYGIISMDFAGGVTSFALTACVGMPIMCLLMLNIPMKVLCRKVLGNEAMISGYDAVQQFCDTNAIMLDSSQLYPEGTVMIKGMKSFKREKVSDALQAGAAVMYAVNGTMSYAFENIVNCPKDNLPKVDSVVYEDEQGLLAWVNKQRVLIGNRLFLETHNVKVPKKELEDKYNKKYDEIVYISINGDTVLMLMLSYRTDRNIAKRLGELQENGVSFIIRTIDPNITKEKISSKFGLFHRCVTILPTGLGTICNDVMTSVDEHSRAYLVTGGKLTSFAKALSRCIKMKGMFMIANLFQYAEIIFGMLICSMISFVSGFQKLGSIEILVYILFWLVATLISEYLKKR